MPHVSAGTAAPAKADERAAADNVSNLLIARFHDFFFKLTPSSQKCIDSKASQAATFLSN